MSHDDDSDGDFADEEQIFDGEDAVEDPVEAPVATEDGAEDGAEEADGETETETEPAEIPPSAPITTVIVVEREHILTPVLSDFEAARILATRADQISHSGIYFCSGKSDNAADLARMELAERKIPLVLRRFRGEAIANGRRETHVEDWDPNTMIFKHDY